MTSSGKSRALRIALLAMAAALASWAPGALAEATPAAPAVAPVPASLERSARREIARRWSVSDEQVALEWGRVSSQAASRLGEDAPLRLLGGDGGWFTAVTGPDADPVALRLHAGVTTTVKVATRALAPGEPLAAGDIGEESRVRFGPPVASIEHDVTIGWEVRRAIRAGEPLAWPAVAPPAVVEAGKPVTVVWERGSVQVRLAGTALADARLGDAVSVRVEQRTGRLTGIATAPGVVRLDGKEQP
jgi:flagella basal body P-ring formation protein FlgA